MSKNYTICYGTPEEVSNEVNILLDDGWELAGNITASTNGSRLYQPMILKTPLKEEKKAMLT